MERPRLPEAAKAAKQERTGKEAAGSGEGQGGKPARLGKDNGSTMRRTGRDQVRRREKYRGQAEQ